MSIWMMVSLVVFVELFLHYALRRDVLHVSLPRPLAYTLGVLGLMGPFSVWLWENRQFEVLCVLWQVIVAGGASVALAYGFDWLVEWKLARLEAKAIEAVKKRLESGGSDATD